MAVSVCSYVRSRDGSREEGRQLLKVMCNLMVIQWKQKFYISQKPLLSYWSSSLTDGVFSHV